MKHQLLFFTACIGFCLSIKGQSGDCKYNASTIKSDFINRILPDKYTWSESTKEAKIITKDGDFLYVKKWACITAGTVARLVVMTEETDVKDKFVPWKEKIIKLGREILSDKDFILFNKYFSDPDLKADGVGTDVVFNIPTKDYTKFVVVVSPLDNMVTVSLLFYKS